MSEVREDYELVVTQLRQEITAFAKSINDCMPHTDIQKAENVIIRKGYELLGSEGGLMIMEEVFTAAENAMIHLDLTRNNLEG